jgi:hypothetical protein
MTVDNTSQGIFSPFPWRADRANPTIFAKDLQRYINKNMSRFNQRTVQFFSRMFMSRKPFLWP